MLYEIIPGTSGNSPSALLNLLVLLRQPEVGRVLISPREAISDCLVNGDCLIHHIVVPSSCRVARYVHEIICSQSLAQDLLLVILRHSSVRLDPCNA